MAVFLEDAESTILQIASILIKGICLSINVCVYWFYKQQACQGRILSPCLFNLYAEYIMRNAKQDEDKGLYCQSYGFSSSHVQMWELDHKEG